MPRPSSLKHLLRFLRTLQQQILRGQVCGPDAILAQQVRITAAQVLNLHASAGSTAAPLQLQAGVRPPSLISGITHCILAYLVLERHSHSVSMDALRRFYYYFDAYATLVMWKASDSLLLLPGSAD